MALVTYDPEIDTFNGKLGNFVYYRNRSLRCVRRYVVPRNPRTECQQQGRRSFADAVHLWQNLEPYKKAQWNDWALARHISGYNLFVSEHLKASWLRFSAEHPALPFFPRPDPLRFTSIPYAADIKYGYGKGVLITDEHG